MDTRKEELLFISL